ncbi:MAG: hypothetical protein ACJ73E_01725 [Mycobacteriales bacterium]
MSRRDGGTVIPLVLLSFLLAGLLVTAGTAASAAFLAQRDLAGVCDGAALAGAAAVDPAAVDPAAVDTGIVLLDPGAVAAATERYRVEAGRPGLALAASTDGRTVTVRCRRAVRIPFGAVLGRAGGLPRTAVARARSVLLPVDPPVDPPGRAPVDPPVGPPVD